MPSDPKLSHLTRIRRQFVVYFCRHRGKFARKDGATLTRFWASPRAKISVKNYMSANPAHPFALYRGNDSGLLGEEVNLTQREPIKSEGTDREASNELFSTSAMTKRSIQLRHPAASTRIRPGIAFLGVCVLVGLVAFFAGARAQVATPVPAATATATPAPTATPFPTFAPRSTPRP